MRWKSACVLPLFVAGCFPEDFPGERVTSLNITGDLEENSCGGSAIAAVDPLVFEVELRAEGDVAYWRRPGSRAMAGTRNETGEYAFSFRSQVQAIEGDETTGAGGCALWVEESIELVLTEIEGATPVDGGPDGGLDAGESDAGADGGVVVVRDYKATGENMVAFEPTAGSNCSPLLATWGGAFESIPCRVEYSLSGESFESPSE